MAEQRPWQGLCDGYIRRAGLIGALYGIVPVVLWFGATFVVLPFREVYVLRFVLALVTSGVAGAVLNRFGLNLWLIKHRSPAGPATVFDGALIGGAIGAGIALLPPLTSLISSNHLEEAKSCIIGAWLLSAVLGCVIGGTLAVMGRQGVEREQK
ncbi:MAG: hypothetical protein NTW87_35940 [Planctomycetota bacterium]|nr:hypothetical protein [Planctomycetota bacterium]